MNPKLKEKVGVGSVRRVVVRKVAENKLKLRPSETALLGMKWHPGCGVRSVVPEPAF